MRYPDPDKFEGKVQTIDPEVFAVFVPIIVGFKKDPFIEDN